MILKLYAIRDSKAEFYNTPFSQKSHGEAERTFKHLATDPKSNICLYPEDFDLYYLGEFDDQTGKMKVLDTPQHMVKAVHTTNQNQSLNTHERVEESKKLMSQMSVQ